MSPKHVEDLFQDLEDLCRETLEYVRGLELEEFLESKPVQRSVERTLELIGEVATRLGTDRPDVGVPWEKLVRLRILLAHAYQKVDPRLLYGTATVSVPELLKALEQFGSKDKEKRKRLSKNR